MHKNTGLVFLAIIGAAMLGGILAALIILPIIASIGIAGRYLRARLLDLEPWPEEDRPLNGDGDAPASTTEPIQSD